VSSLAGRVSPSRGPAIVTASSHPPHNWKALPPWLARLPYLDRADVKPEHQDLLTRNINLYRALVHSPDGLRTFSALGHFIRHTSRLDPRLREMAILQVGYLARSPYEYSHHVEIGRDFGVSDDEIRAIAMRPPDARPSSNLWPRRCCAPRAR
jgi:alkylhydroperoxidase family enzyme